MLDYGIDSEGNINHIAFNPTLERKKHAAKEIDYTVWGKKFGYPGCCIRYFCATLFPGLSLPDDHWASGTGYVPCPECRNIPKEEIIGVINSRRQVEDEFKVEENNNV